MKKVYKLALVGMMVGLLSGPQFVPSCFGAASGNYTDLLPIGAASDTTVISRGTGYAVTTLPTSQTFGDALSRLSYTAYQATAAATISNSATVSTITALNQGNVGSTTFPASWIATGRSIRITSSGVYNSSTTAVNWTWDVLLGTTSILSTGAKAAPISQTGSWFNSVALLTIAATGTSGTVNGTYNILVTSGAIGTANVVSYSTYTTSAVSVDLTSQLVIRPRFTWGTASTSSAITFNNVIVEFLN